MDKVHLSCEFPKVKSSIFQSEIVVDNVAVTCETKAYKKIPQIVDFS